MKILVDTTISKMATVTLTRGSEILATKTGTDALLLATTILTENKLSLAEVEFELKNEPGSYTGLKVGASMVNTLNFVNGKSGLVIPHYQLDSK